VRKRFVECPRLDEPASTFDVELAFLDAKPIPRRLRLETAGTERLSELRDVDLDRFRRRLRRLVLPDRVDQVVLRNDPVRLEKKQSEDSALFLPAEVERLPAREHLERTEDPELQAEPTVTPRSGLLKERAWARLNRRVTDL
jgi:hypothetical protein